MNYNQLFTLWIGDSVPDYINNNVERFKLLNPSFNVYFIRYSYDDIYKQSDPICSSIRDSILKVKPNIDLQSYEYFDRYINAFGYTVTHTYKGFYIHANCYQWKSLDDRIIKNGWKSYHTYQTRYKTSIINSTICTDECYYYETNSKQYHQTETLLLKKGFLDEEKLKQKYPNDYFFHMDTHPKRIAKKVHYQDFER